MQPSTMIALAASTLAVGAAANNAAIAAADMNAALRETPRKKGSKRSKGRPQKPEELFAPLIKMGKVRVVRRKGQPPLIQWL